MALPSIQRTFAASAITRSPVEPQAAAAAAVPTSAAATPDLPPPTPAIQMPQHAKAEYRIRSGLILTRAPLLTREPTPFESAFFLYQKRLNERTVSPFVKGFYFKPDTPPLLDWELKLKERQGIVAKDIGLYRARGVSAWADEAPLGSKLADQAALRDRLAQDSEVRFSDDGELIADQDRVPVEKPLPRTTEADEKGDVRRLDRALERTLYLVVKGRDGAWQFPSDYLTTDENLHETAARVLEQAAGVNMNTWIVGRVPVAHHVVKPDLNEDSTIKAKGIKTFFLKGRIMTGQADIENNTLGVTDFKWLTQDELKDELPPAYYRSIRNMLGDR